MILRTKQKKLSRKLRSQGFSIKQIAKKLQVSTGSVSAWVRDIPLSEDQKYELKQKEVSGGIKGRATSRKKWTKYRLLHPKPIPKVRLPRYVDSFFDKWTPDMAYVLGYFAADGTMFKNINGSAYIAFTSTDKELIDQIKSILRISNKIEIYQQPMNRKTRYNLQIGSKRLFNTFLNLGFTPAKSLTLKFPTLPKKMIGHFVRGYFDGDGCAYYYCTKRKSPRSGLVKAVTLSFVCGSKGFLEAIQKILVTEAKIGYGSLSVHTRSYQLAYSTYDVIKLYSFMYPNKDIPCLIRKKEVLKKGLSLFGLEV